MNFEALEQMRYENTKKVMEELTAIVSDPKVDVKDRILAAKVVDAMSDTLVHAQMMSDMSHQDARVKNKMVDQLGKLRGKFED